MVVMFVDFCVGVYGTFRTIPTVESYGAGVFLFPPEPIAVKLLSEIKLVMGLSVVARLDESYRE